MYAALLLAALAACDDPTLDDDSLNKQAAPELTDTVYAGEDADGNWVTFAFTVENGAKTLFYFPGTPSDTPREGYPGQLACLRADYTFDHTTGGGNFTVIRTDSTQTPPVVTKDPPAAFSIIEDGLTLTADAYPERQFLRVRNAEAEDEPVPFQFEPLQPTDSLAGTVWAGTAYRTKDWTTLTVTDDSTLTAGTIHVTHSFDCTSYPRAYSGYAYNTETALYYVGPFKVYSNYFIFSNFYGHRVQIKLKRMR